MRNSIPESRNRNLNPALKNAYFPIPLAGVFAGGPLEIKGIPAPLTVGVRSALNSDPFTRQPLNPDPSNAVGERGDTTLKPQSPNPALRDSNAYPPITLGLIPSSTLIPQ